MDQAEIDLVGGGGGGGGGDEGLSRPGGGGWPGDVVALRSGGRVPGRTDTGSATFRGLLRSRPSKHETSTHCWTNVGPASTTLAQQWFDIGLMSRVFRREKCCVWLNDTGRPAKTAVCWIRRADTGLGGSSRGLTLRKNKPAAWLLAWRPWNRGFRASLPHTNYQCIHF